MEGSSSVDLRQVHGFTFSGHVHVHLHLHLLVFVLVLVHRLPDGLEFPDAQ